MSRACPCPRRDGRRSLPALPRDSYKDSASAYGPCNAARAIAGEIKVSCRASVEPIPYTLDELAQVSVGVRVGSADTAYSAEFGGILQRDQPGTFRAKLAGRPVACPMPPPCP